jgi:tetratricopeptide (TPR) repeat protein
MAEITNVPFVFISHASKDDEFVKTLRLALEAHRVPVWVDSRNLRGGVKLAPEISAAIEHARQFIVVLSPNTIDSSWVRREVEKALEVEKQRTREGYRVVPLMLPGIRPSDLAEWFGEEPVGVRVELAPGGLTESLTDILAALGQAFPDDRKPPPAAPTTPVAELLLRLTDPLFQNEHGARHASATATLVYQPPHTTGRVIASERFSFRSPFSAIEGDDLRWYLEKSYLWPTGIFKARADRIEAQLPAWGQALYREATTTESSRNTLTTWQNEAEAVDRRFSVSVDWGVRDGASPDQTVAKAVISDLLALPWELLHDGRGYLFHGKRPVRVRRVLPIRHSPPVPADRFPIRVLVVSPRPETDRTAYSDYRTSARPVIEALDTLGELVRIAVLTPPTFQALQEELQDGAKRGQPYDVVHFDGHGAYDDTTGLDALCFEDAKDQGKLEGRASHVVHAAALAGILRDYGVTLVFLEAFRSYQAPRAEPSLAASLLDEGVMSVVTMTHGVLVETARRFVTAFYRELARGARVGTAMLAGQQALHTDSYRGRILGGGELRLQDWFVPVLYQGEQDPRLVTRLPSEQAQRLVTARRRLNLGDLPPAPPHEFAGRSRDLLALERMLLTETSSVLSYAVVRGAGGEGKTTLAVELARWLTQTRRFERTAFIAVADYTDARGLLESLGRQLLPEGERYSVAEYRNLDEARQPVERTLRELPTLIVLDNVESALPDPSGRTARPDAPFGELATLCQDLLRAHPATRLVFTSRERLPEPFDHAGREWLLRRLPQSDAITLVSQVMKRQGAEPAYDEKGELPRDVIDLVEAADGHARALTLLAREVVRRGVRVTTENLRRIMGELHRKYPDTREASLYASVQLSLNRLSPEMRAHVASFGVFHGGASLDVVRAMLDLDIETTRRLADELIEVGLAEEAGYGHLRFDPALPPYLLGLTNEQEEEEARSKWAASLARFAAALAEQRSQNTEIAAKMTRLQLPNLLAMLEWMSDRTAPEGVVGIASALEGLIAPLGLPRALSRATAAREEAAQKLTVWSRARVMAEGQAIERLLERGRLPEARAAAERLVEELERAGEDAYPEAANDIPVAYLRLGRVLGKMGDHESALPFLVHAQQRLEVLAAAGTPVAEEMAIVAGTERAGYLLELGRPDEAAPIYEEALERAAKRDDRRSVAVNTLKLGTVRQLQGHHAEALKVLFEGKALFEQLSEPLSIATAWQQIGAAFQAGHQFEAAEDAYRQALAIRVQHQTADGEAQTLSALGDLLVARGRLDEGVILQRQAADRFAQLQDLNAEGMVRNNLAATLLTLRRYEDARAELNRAIACKMQIPRTSQPWTTLIILQELEKAIGDTDAAASAGATAIRLYVAYRRAGGISRNPRVDVLTRVMLAVVRQNSREVATLQAQLAAAEIANDDTGQGEALVAALQAILAGSRDQALARNPALNYLDAAELQLLLEELTR